MSVCIMCLFVCLTATKSRNDALQVSDAMTLDVTHPQQLSVTSSSASSSSSSSSTHQHQSPVHNDVTQFTPSSRRRNTPPELPLDNESMELPGGSPVTSPHWKRPEVNPVEEGQPNTAAVPPVRRRAVDLSDLRSCALVHTQMKTKKPPAAWRYVTSAPSVIEKNRKNKEIKTNNTL